jgi:hypothetical protein
MPNSITSNVGRPVSASEEVTHVYSIFEFCGIASLIIVVITTLVVEAIHAIRYIKYVWFNN